MRLELLLLIHRIKHWHSNQHQCDKGQVRCPSKLALQPLRGGDPVSTEKQLSQLEMEARRLFQGQGTYAIAPDGAVTFTPDKQFVGKPQIQSL